ncbi:MAG: CD225/dispanin family protein [Bacteroidales bacterium]
MKKYYYSDGTNQFGPFTLEELRNKNITRETLVWFPELSRWKPAGTIPELATIFEPVPPPLTKQYSDYNNPQNLDNQKPPKTWLVESILVTLFCCLPFGIVGIVYAAKVESRFYAGDIVGANRAAAEAKKWTTISFWIGIAAGLIYLITFLAGFDSVF